MYETMMQIMGMDLELRILDEKGSGKNENEIISGKGRTIEYYV